MRLCEQRDVIIDLNPLRERDFLFCEIFYYVQYIIVGQAPMPLLEGSGILYHIESEMWAKRKPSRRRDGGGGRNRSSAVSDWTAAADARAKTVGQGAM